MMLTDGEKLILAMLCDIQIHLNIHKSVDPKFVKEAIQSGNAWGLKGKYRTVFYPDEASENVVSEVRDIMAMWSLIESSYYHLSAADKLQVDTHAKPSAEIFRGFNLDHESEHLNVATFYLEKLGACPDLKGRDLNSLSPTLEMHRRMLAAYDPMRGSGLLTATQIIELLIAHSPPDGKQ